MRICHCHNVSDSAIRACASDGGSTIGAVARATRAGTGCGGCVPAIREIVESLRGTPPDGGTERSLPIALPIAAE